jgi:hypothetical protein
MKVVLEMDEPLRTAIMTLDERLRRIEQHIENEKFERIENYADNLFGTEK